MPPLDEDPGTIDFISNAVFATGALVLQASAVRIARHANEPSTNAAR